MEIPRGMDVGKYDQLNITPEGWRTLARDLARHLIDRYGRDEVRTWFFEVWNEPDNWDLETLCNYYDGCSEGLKEADPKLRWGGPGTWNTLFDLFKGLLKHCESEKNYFTGETGVRMDFISVHEKGIKRSDFYDGSPDVKEWIDRQIATLRYIRENHPRFARTLFINDEADLKSGWWHNYRYRDTAYFPAMICKYMSHVLRRITGPMGAETIMSNDNAFIGEWGKRSHVVRFGEPKKFELVKKPVNAGMVMLSLLGDRQCEAQQPDLFSDVGAIASRRGDDQVAVLIYNCNETATREKHDDAKWVLEEYGTARVKLSLEGVPFREGMLAHYRIDKDHTNPYSVWKAMGEPKEPTADQLAKMRGVQELVELEEPRLVQAKNGRLTLEFDLPMPGVSLVLLSAKPAKAPAKVVGLRAERSPGLLEKDEILLVWKGVDSRVLRTYEVLYSESPDGPFKRVNEGSLLCTAFLHVRDSQGKKGYYKLRAADYWGRAGQESDPVASP
jgi:L-iduronidase